MMIMMVVNSVCQALSKLQIQIIITTALPDLESIFILTLQVAKLRHKGIKVTLIKVTEPRFKPGSVVPEFTNVIQNINTESIFDIYIKLVFIQV